MDEEKYTEEIYKMPVDGLQIHPVAETTPVMKEEQFHALKLDIEVQGQKKPAIMYRGRIVDGRHRLRALNELQYPTIDVIKMAQNSTTEQLRACVKSSEVGRHQSPGQLAVSAFKALLAGEYSTQIEAAEAVGVSAKQVQRANKIGVKLGRMDIIDSIFNGKGINTGSEHKPLVTDSLSTIEAYLINQKSREAKDITGIDITEELGENEEILLGQMIGKISTQSELFRNTLVERLYAKMHNAGADQQ